MWRLIIGTRDELSASLYDALLQFRYDVFVHRLGWRLPMADNGRERDEFDTDRAIYLVAQDAHGAITGSARLLSTTGPYLLGEVFPDTMVESAPRSADQWELSRFAAAPASSALGTPHFARALFQACLSQAHRLGATRLVGVLSCAMERVCRGFGADLVRLGPPKVFAGERVVACAVRPSDGLRPMSSEATFQRGKTPRRWSFVEPERVSSALSWQATPFR